MYELTTQQQNIWNLQSYYENTSISNISGILHFKERLNTDILKKAVNMYVKYQEGARLRFIKKEGRVKQYVADYEPFDIPVRQFASLKDMCEFASREAKAPYHFGRNGEASECMYHFTIYETEDVCGIITHMNHLISDAWTLSLFCEMVIEFYQMLINGAAGDIKAHSYIDYIQKEQKYLSSDKFQNDALYWNERFRKAPVRKRIKPEGREDAGISSLRFTEKIDSVQSGKIRGFCKKHGYSPAILFESVIFVYLSRINGEGKETIIGVPVLNRTGSDKKTAGMFISTMPLGIEVEAEDTMLKVCQKVSLSHFELFRHQKFPYSDILKHVRRTYGFEGNLYDVVVSYQNAVVGKTDEMEYETEWLNNGFSEVPMAFHIDDRDESGGFTINMDVQEDMFSRKEAQWLLKRILHMAVTAAENEEIAVENMPIMSEEEYGVVVNRFNDTRVEYPRKKCIHELFTEQAAKTPDRTALVFEDKKFTYRQLDEMSNSLAHYLRKKGVKPNDVVPIIAKRSWHVVVAMLGVLKAGGAYMPVDPAFPEDRIECMLDETNSKLILTYGWKNSKKDIKSIKLEQIDYCCSTKKIINKNCAADLCYVLFTSGSTGKPKAALISHANLGNFINNNNNNNMYQCNMVNSCQCVLADAAFTFDISVFEIFLTLLNGLTVILSKDMSDALYLAELIQKYKVDVIHITPTKILMLLKNKEFQKAVAKIKMLMIGAETFSKELYKTISLYTDAVIYNGYGPTETTIGCSFKRINHINRKNLECRIYNVYGPAETTVWSTNAEVNDGDITIGSPIANTQIYILDKDNSLLPIGVAGELCIAGEGVGKGYLNQPELTKEKFVPNPFATKENHHGRVMYHTGDLARWRADGELEFLGRIDTQVKIRGLRIELGEIENVLSAFDGIELCAVTDKKDETGRQFLAAYYTSKNELDSSAMRRHLSEKLPAYMIPNYFMRLKHMPLTSSGKTDRKNLPMPDLSDIISEYIPPETELERLLCKLYGQALNIEKVGRTDDFFELGGDSLAAMSLISSLSDSFEEVSLQWIFEKPVVKDFAQLLEKYSNSCHAGEGGSNAKKERESKNEGSKRQMKEKSRRYGRYQEFLRLYGTGAKSGIVLTGATGFLGAHILKELLEKYGGEREIYCLLRGSDNESAKNRLRHVMEDYFNQSVADSIKNECGVHVIACDVTENPVKCIKMALKKYPSFIAKIIHTAALVKHYGEYGTFYKINVGGTKKMISAAKEFGAELLHISTESVGGLYIEDEEYARKAGADAADKNIRKFTEEDFYIGQNLDNVYIKSKFEAERQVLDYLSFGGRAGIIRVGNLANRYSDGRFQNNFAENAFLRRMHTFLSLGAYPDVLINTLLDFSPVDETARAVVTLAFQNAAPKQCIYHVSHSSPITYGQLAERMSAIGRSMQALPTDEFAALLKPGNVSHDYVKNDLNEIKKMAAYMKVVPVNDRTSRKLKDAGFIWKAIDDAYLKRYAEYAEGLKF